MIETSTCPSCGGVIEKGDRFCQECGRALSTVATSPPKSLVEKLHSFRAELILVGAVVIYAASVVCWTDRASLTKPESNVDSQTRPTARTAGGASVKASQSAEASSELQRLFSKSQTFPSVNLAKVPAPPAKRMIAARKLAAPIHCDSTKETVAEATSEIASDSAAETTDTKARTANKSIKSDTKAIADVAEYNRLLADYFARKKSDSDSSDTAGEPPSYQEWIAGRKPYF